MLQIGKMYKTPWKLSSYEASFAPDHMLFDWGKRVDIPDGAYVVVLGVEKYGTQKSSYFLKLLTGEGRLAYVEVTEAGLDYWKIVRKD